MGIQGEVKIENVDSWFSEDSELPGLDVSADQCRHVLSTQVALTGDSRYLKVGGRRCDVRVKAGGRGRDQINRYRCTCILRLHRGGIPIHPVDQGMVARREIGAT